VPAAAGTDTTVAEDRAHGGTEDQDEPDHDSGRFVTPDRRQKSYFTGTRRTRS
jgi:hypothetical protein